MIRILDFPEGCTSFRGPHKVECLNYLWTSAGCAEEGKHFPAKMPTNRREFLNSLDIKYVIIAVFAKLAGT